MRDSVDLTRRAVLLGGTAAIAARLRAQSKPASFAYVGCYTTAQRYARGDGIHIYRVDAETGVWTHLDRVGELVNPSFLTLSRDQRFLYSAHGDETYATAFKVDRETGRLTLLGRTETGGRNGVHLAVDPGGRFAIVANYGSGSIALLPIRKDGSLDAPSQTIVLEGQPGPHRIEQPGSRPHQIVFDPSGRYVVVPDKGLDRVFVFRFDAETGRLSPTAQGSVVARAGSGPRHAAFHPTLPVVWVLNEIASSVTTYYWDAERGHLRPAEVLPSTAPEHTSENTAAEIAVSRDGGFVYCSNRGHDSIACFAADHATGLLKPAGWTATQGRTPRFICIDPTGRFLYAANEQSDTIVAFRLDARSGGLTPAGQVIRNASPVTIAFASSPAPLAHARGSGGSARLRPEPRP
jgi:6-phosphogluconolactonase (cycloisomerase 2 family)